MRYCFEHQFGLLEISTVLQRQPLETADPPSVLGTVILYLGSKRPPLTSMRFLWPKSIFARSSFCTQALLAGFGEVHEQPLKSGRGLSVAPRKHSNHGMLAARMFGGGGGNRSIFLSICELKCPQSCPRLALTAARFNWLVVRFEPSISPEFWTQSILSNSPAFLLSF